mgnify:CR=1 FL=1
MRAELQAEKKELEKHNAKRLKEKAKLSHMSVSEFVRQSTFSSKVQFPVYSKSISNNSLFVFLQHDQVIQLLMI